MRTSVPVSEHDDQHHAAQATATMVDVAAAEIDHVNSRNIGRLVADRYYGLL